MNNNKTLFDYIPSYVTSRTEEARRLALIVFCIVFTSFGIFFIALRTTEGSASSSTPLNKNERKSLPLLLWPSPGPYISMDTLSRNERLEIEDALLLKLAAYPSLVCLHAASLYNPAANILMMQLDGERWLVHDPILEYATGSPVKHHSIINPSAIRITPMASRVTLRFKYGLTTRIIAGSNQLVSPLVIENKTLAQCLQTIDGIK